MSFRRSLIYIALAAGPWLAVPAMAANCGNGRIDGAEQCDDGSANGGPNSCCTSACTLSAESPDLIVSLLQSVGSWGSVGDIHAYSVGTTVCNLGSCWANWVADTAQHPVIGQNMFRLKDGRLEQIGQAWVKHGFNASAGTFCSTSCIPSGSGEHLGVSCSDAYGNSLNANQTSLGPKVDVNPNTGVFPYPDSRINTTGNAVFKRLQVHHADLDPAVNAGALYFVEAQYVAHDDAVGSNNANNASYSAVSFDPSSYVAALVGSTQIQKAGIQAWKAADPAVTETTVAAPEGAFILAAKATSLGNGIYHYEYALHNLTNQRGGQSFAVPLPPGTIVTNVGFHDVDYHSGEPFDGTDWTPTVSSSSVTWATTPYAMNANANALRWGTLYNFRFDANQAPGTSSITIGLFRPGSPASVSVTTVTPGACGGAPNGTACSDGNGCTLADSCQSGACVGGNPVTCTASDACHDAGTCSPATGVCSNPARPDGSGCDDGSACTANDACSGGICVGEGSPTPGEVDDGVQVSREGMVAAITWNPASGSTESAVLRGSLHELPVGPGGGDEVCLESAVAGTSATDAGVPDSGEGFWYLVRGANGCGSGSYGSQTQNGSPTVTRMSTTCP